MVDVSVVIVSYNSRDYLDKCIQSIRDTFPAGYKFEIIVIDNASTDGSIEMLWNDYPWVKAIKNLINNWHTGGANQGIKMAEGRYIWMLGPDTFIEDSPVKPVLEYMEKSPDVGAVSTILYFPDHTIQKSVTNESHFDWLQFFGRKPKHILNPGNADVLADSCIFVRSKILKFNPYDENLKLYYVEKDLCRRIKRDGWVLYYYPVGKVIHDMRGSVRKDLETASRIYREDFIEYHLKYNPTAIPFVIGADWISRIFRRRSIFYSSLLPAKDGSDRIRTKDPA